MDAYAYNPKTGEYIGVVAAVYDPVDKVYRPPAGAVMKDPGKAAKGKAAVYSDGSWVMLDDYRGVYYNADGEQQVVIEIGVVPSVEWTKVEPATGESENEEAILALEVKLMGAAKILLKVVTSMYKAGVETGVWNKSDFDDGVIASVQELRQALSDLESLRL